MTESNKSELLNNGYTIFNLYDIDDSEIHNALSEIQNLSNTEFKNLRYKKMGAESNTFLKDSFENLESFKQSLNKDNLYEVWYYNDVDKNLFKKSLLNKIYNYFYNGNIDEFYHSSCISMYNDDCFLVEHWDGFNPNSKYKCVILIYLNDESEIKSGGELVLDGKIVVKPTIGTIVLMDFTKNDIKHGVKKVNGYQRKCYLNFC